MLAVIQRVDRASVEVEKQIVGKAERGILALIGIEPQDDLTVAKRLIDKIINYRIFEDEEGKMNLSLHQVNGDLLLVPQFTLAADTQKGMRPSFSTAAAPSMAQSLFETMLDLANRLYPNVTSGQFGAHMYVHLINNGPVTFILKV